MTKVPVRLTVNGEALEFLAEPRKLLSDALREDADLTGTHVGCEHGVCGACTVLVDGRPVRSCLLFAVQMQAPRITTIEAVARDGSADPAATGAARGARSAMRFLHPGHRHDAGSLAARPPCARPRTRFAKRCPAICAAAPATITSCGRC